MFITNDENKICSEILFFHYIIHKQNFTTIIAASLGAMDNKKTNRKPKNLTPIFNFSSDSFLGIFHWSVYTTTTDAITQSLFVGFIEVVVEVSESVENTSDRQKSKTWDT